MFSRICSQLWPLDRRNVSVLHPCSQKESTGCFLLMVALACLHSLRHNLNDVDVSPEVFLFLTLCIHLLLFTGSEMHFLVHQTSNSWKFHSRTWLYICGYFSHCTAGAGPREDSCRLAGRLDEEGEGWLQAVLVDNKTMQRQGYSAVSQSRFVG